MDKSDQFYSQVINAVNETGVDSPQVIAILLNIINSLCLGSDTTLREYKKILKVMKNNYKNKLKKGK